MYAKQHLRQRQQQQQHRLRSLNTSSSYPSMSAHTFIKTTTHAYIHIHMLFVYTVKWAARCRKEIRVLSLLLAKSVNNHTGLMLRRLILIIGNATYISQVKSSQVNTSQVPTTNKRLQQQHRVAAVIFCTGFSQMMRSRPPAIYLLFLCGNRSVVVPFVASNNNTNHNSKIISAFATVCACLL